MSKIEIVGMDRLTAAELQKLAKVQGLEDIHVKFPPNPTGRPGMLDQVVAVLPHVSSLTPLLLTAWIVSSKELHVTFSKSDPVSGERVNFEVQYSQEDPSQLLSSLKEFLGF